jgi:YegS/Rv2252/BmrU family lipid kinase
MSTEDILKKYKKTKSIIMAVGGDGTINRVLNGIVGTKNILGYIPYGTGNDFYRANQEVLNKGINTIDLISINNKYFINIACFGIDAVIGNNSDIIHSKIIPKSQRYNVGILYHFFKYRARSLKIVIGENTYSDRYTTVAVCNAKYYGNGYKIGTNSSLTDGLVDVYMASKMSKINMARLILGMKDGKHETSKKLKKVSTDKLTIISEKPITCNMDGEELTSDKFEIEVIPRGIEVYYDQSLIDEFIK